MAINEVRIFAGKAGDLEMPIETREALGLKDNDLVEVVIRKKAARMTISPEIMKKHNLFIRSV